jgi:energy-coupling factor transporter ATP-binding protein EcfA2
VGTFDWEVERLAIRMGERSNKITSLSGGNQQKVLIGRAFALNPDILVLNDPARGIDVGAKAELYRHLREFAAQGKSVIYLSSEIEEFVGFCSRVLVFRNGSVFDEFTGPDIHPTPILEAMFGQTRAGQVHPVDVDPAFEEEPMKIVEFGGDAATPQPGDADHWKRRSSPYPGFDKKPSHTDAPSLEALRGARATPDASDVQSDLPASSSSSARPKIKIMEFNTGGAASGRAAPVASAAVRQDTAPAPAVKSTMKIMEFDDRAAPAARSAVASGRSGIKIVEYGEAAKGSRS